jgi:uncharacterized membrane protein
MGFWDSIVGSDRSEKPAESGKNDNPFNVSISFSPLRLSAMNRSSVTLNVKIKNVSGKVQLVSVDALLPKDSLLGFDPACINKAAEKRVGELKPGQTIEAAMTVFSSNQTKEGNYPVEVTVFSHYIGYDKVLSYLKKSTSIRAV